MSRSADGRNWRGHLDAIAAVALTVASVVLVWHTLWPAGPVRSTRPDLPLPTEPISLDGAATKGNPTARVALIEFSDFQCPDLRSFCFRHPSDA